MSAFKDMVARDVKGVFLNTLEFSDIHNVNGVEMPVQIDGNEQIERQKRQTEVAEGIFVNQKLIYVAAEDFGALPRIESVLKLDGKTYRVADAIDEDGIYSITIEANRGR